ncbi:unnamed protein product, partial [Polarella glacialis]
APLGAPYLFAWPVLLWTFIALIVIGVTFSDEKRLRKLSATESHIASWYLINGFFFNSMMDVFAGQFGSWTTMTQRYHELEPRYAMDGYVGVVVLLTSLQELCIQTPCGLFLFYAYWRGSSWRLGVEVIFNMWSIAGVWYFYVSEAILGFPNVHAPVTSDGRFDLSSALSFDTVYKFWIGFVIFPALWACVGAALAIRACWQISELCCRAEDSSKKQQ